jgi:hypothetical protein
MPAHSAEYADEPVDRETVMQLILRAVEQGSITVEEAAEKLAQLELAAAEEAASIPSAAGAPEPADNKDGADGR